MVWKFRALDLSQMVIGAADVDRAHGTAAPALSALPAAHAADAHHSGASAPARIAQLSLSRVQRNGHQDGRGPLESQLRSALLLRHGLRPAAALRRVGDPHLVAGRDAVLRALDDAIVGRE